MYVTNQLHGNANCCSDTIHNLAHHYFYQYRINQRAVNISLWVTGCRDNCVIFCLSVQYDCILFQSCLTCIFVYCLFGCYSFGITSYWLFLWLSALSKCRLLLSLNDNSVVRIMVSVRQCRVTQNQTTAFQCHVFKMLQPNEFAWFVARLQRCFILKCIRYCFRIKGVERCQKWCILVQAF